jgi:lipoprotein-anchoring transpeptidase ErfK/SrfK
VFLRRKFIFGLTSALLAGCTRTSDSVLAEPQVTSSFAAGAAEPELTALELTKRNPELARQLVTYKGPERPGTIVVRTVERKLYYILADDRAIRYPVGVGRYGKQWQGRAEIDGKHVNPAWSPPDDVLRDNPRLPAVYPGGSPDNPMGPRALTLSGGEGYAIHGTTRPQSIGTFASYGCIRMFNEDILDLYDRVNVGTEVIVSL